MKPQLLFVASSLLLAGCADDGGTAAGAGSAASLTPVERGLALANAKACTACHALDGTRGIGPSWVGIYGNMTTFADGGTAIVDEVYLRRSMREPAAQVVEGFDNVMVPAAVTDDEVLDIIALIKALQDGPLP
jgi:cytochrome c oxidase subunit II